MTRLLVVGGVWPEPRSSAAGAHILQVLRPLLHQGWNVTYASTAADSQYAADLPSLGVSTEGATVNDASFDDLLRSLRPDVVIFDRFFIEEQFGWRVDEHCPDALRILNCEDLHFLRDARERTTKAAHSFQQPDLKNKTSRREVAAILRSDLTLVISEFEMEVLTHTFGIDPELIHYTPFMLEPPAPVETSRLPTFDARRDFFYVGNFRHAPNWDGVQWLKTEVWPLIRKRLPEAHLHIAGSYASREQLSLHDPKEGFLVDGRIEDSDARFRESRVCIAPLRFGAGLKGKLIDAMRNGTPSVTTSIGAEGINGDLPWCGAVEENADRIAQAAVRLYESRTEWESAQKNGFRILEQRFSRSRHEPLLARRIQAAHQHLAQRRANNFTGEILRDQHHRSTRYMSLWIEAKNKLAATSQET